MSHEQAGPETKGVAVKVLTAIDLGHGDVEGFGNLELSPAEARL